MTKQSSRGRNFTRREFIKSSAIGSVGMLAGLTGVSRLAHAQEPVVFHISLPMSGAYAATGRDGTRGTRLAVELRDGKVLGRPIKFIERDNASAPAVGVRKAKEAVEKLGAKYIIVGTSSAVFLAVMKYAAEHEVVVNGGGGADAITGESCNYFTFRRQIPTYGAIEEVVPRLIEMGANSFYTITPEYVFGEDLLKNTKRVLEREGKKFLGNSFHPLGALEYSSYITRAMATKPDCLLLLNFSADTNNCIKQAVGFGVKERALLAAAWGSGLTQYKAIGAEILEDVIFGCQYWHQVDTPVNNAFVKAYREAYGVNPPYTAAASYGEIEILLAGIERAGTADDTKAVVEAIEDWEYEGLVGSGGKTTEYYRSCDHNCVHNYHTLRAKAPGEMKYDEDYVEIVGASARLVPCEESGCDLVG